MLGVTLSGTAQAIGYLVLIVVALLAVKYGWYRLRNRDHPAGFREWLTFFDREVR